MPDDKFPKASTEYDPEFPEEDLINYVLGELPPNDIPRVEAKIQSSPKLIAEVERLKKIKEEIDSPKGKSEREKTWRFFMVMKFFSGGPKVSPKELAELEKSSPQLAGEIKWLNSQSASWEGLKVDARLRKIKDILNNRKYDSH